MKLLSIPLLAILLSFSARADFVPLRTKSVIQAAVYGAEKNIAEIFKQVDYNTLKSLIEAKDEKGMRAFNLDLADNIAEYIYQNYHEDIRNEVAESPEATIVLGYLFFGKENSVTGLEEQTKSQGKSDPAVGCLIGAVSGILGIGEINHLYNDFLHGASATTVLKALKVMLRRVAGWWTVTTSVYGFGECMNWW